MHLKGIAERDSILSRAVIALLNELLHRVYLNFPQNYTDKSITGAPPADYRGLSGAWRPRLPSAVWDSRLILCFKNLVKQLVNLQIFKHFILKTLYLLVLSYLCVRREVQLHIVQDSGLSERKTLTHVFDKLVQQGEK